jgi:uncharacterized glyoxalase superfamily protein PhnB|nr:VOC family protein [Kofleriaceae bacterium]
MTTPVASKPLPAGWPRISASLAVANASAAIEFYCTAFGFEVRLRVDGDAGRVEHSELVLGGGLIMVGDPAPEKGRPWVRTPKSLDGANTQQMMVYVDDVEAHCARARAAGAVITTEPKTTDYGDDYWSDRAYEAMDPDGHRWYFTQRLKTLGK